MFSYSVTLDSHWSPCEMENCIKPSINMYSVE